MTEFSNLAPITTAITISGLNTVAGNAYSLPSSLIDNTAATKSYLTGWVRLTFTAGGTGSGTPYITIFAHEARDGSNIASPPGTSAIAPSVNARQVICQLPPSSPYAIVDFPAIDLGPFMYSFQIYNNTGATFSGTVTATLYRGDIQGV